MKDLKKYLKDKKLTGKQIDAVTAPIGQNTLISAGAGSGKTKVLSIRVPHLLEDENVDISQLLILTFTKDAAAEMKRRIKDEIIKEHKNIIDILPLVDSSHIETYDAFRLFIVKKYSHLVGISKDIEIIDKDVLDCKYYEIINEVLNEEYEKCEGKDDEPLFFIVKNYLDKDDNNLVGFLLKICKEIYYEDEDKIIDEYQKKFLTDEFFDNFILDLFNRIKKLQKEAKKLSLSGDQKIEDYYNFYFSPIETAKSLNEILELGELFKEIKRVTCKDEGLKEIYESIKNIKSQLQIDYINIINLDKLKEIDIPNHKKIIPFLLNLAIKINQKIKAFKKNNGSFTFDDISYFAYKILKEHDDIRENIKNNFKEIIIDEYQDTSDKDEEFINLIENHNVFAVGDIKQSIYLFRGANPENFKRKSDLYSKDPSKGQLIRMNDNFRSRKEIIKGINDLFGKEMTLEVGGVNYLNQEELNPGNGTYDILKPENQEFGFLKLKFNESLNAENSYYREAELVAKDILNRINNKEKVVQSNNKGESYLRDLKFSDFAILCSTKQKTDYFEEIFGKYGIPLNIYSDEELMENNVILTLISILKFVNFYNLGYENNLNLLKKCFISIVRSFLFEYSDEDIYKLIKDNQYFNDDTYNKLIQFSQLHMNISINELFNDILKEFDFVKNLAKFLNPFKELNTLSLLNNKSKQMDKLSFNIEEFVSYLENINKFEIKIDVSKQAESDNAVTLCSIHKSKGLQYKIVYFPQLKGKGKNETDTFVGNLKTGFYLPFKSNKTGEISYIYKFYDDSKEKLNSEDLRKLYVALTRAEEVGIFVISPETKGGTYNTGLARFLNNFIFTTPDSKYFDQDVVYNENSDDAKSDESKIPDITIGKPINLGDEIDDSRKRASKALNEDSNEDILTYGTHMHLLMELIDFKNIDLSFIEDSKEREIVEKLFKLDIFSNLNKAINIYKEYQFYDSKNNINGVIDLMIEYQDRIDLIDYKLKDIEDNEYITQLKIYKQYIKERTKKNVSCYLLSLLDNNYKKLDV